MQLTVIHARIRVFSRDFPALCLIFNSSSAYCVTGETVETTTDERNSSFIGRDNMYISSKKREFSYLFGVLRRLQHCTGHITTGSWKGRGNQYIQFVRVLYCKLPTNGKQLPAFPFEAVPGIEPRPQRWEARVLPLCHRGPLKEKRRNAIYLFI